MFTPRGRHQLARILLVAAVVLGAMSTAAGKGKPATPPRAGTPTPMQVFGVWHCGNHYCDWNEEVDMVAFAEANRWLLKRTPGGTPAVNVVVLSFVNPLKMLNYLDYGLSQMIPRGFRWPCNCTRSGCC